MKTQLAPGGFNWFRRSPGGCRRWREASRDGPELTEVRGFIVDWRRDQRLPSRSSPFSSLSYCSCAVACLLSCPSTLFSCISIQKVIKHLIKKNVENFSKLKGFCTRSAPIFCTASNYHIPKQGVFKFRKILQKISNISKMAEDRRGS